MSSDDTAHATGATAGERSSKSSSRSRPAVKKRRVTQRESMEKSAAARAKRSAAKAPPTRVNLREFARSLPASLLEKEGFANLALARYLAKIVPSGGTIGSVIKALPNLTTFIRVLFDEKKARNTAPAPKALED